MVLPFILYYLASNRLQKGEKLVKGVNKLVGKVLIYLLCHKKSAVCIIIDAPAIAYAMVSS